MEKYIDVADWFDHGIEEGKEGLVGVVLLVEIGQVDLEFAHILFIFVVFASDVVSADEGRESAHVEVSSFRGGVHRYVLVLVAATEVQDLVELFGVYDA